MTTRHLDCLFKPRSLALVEADRAHFSIKSKKTEGTLVEVALPPTRVLAAE